jgi:hypothetical protein
MGKFGTCVVISRKRAEAIAGILGFTLPVHLNEGSSHVVLEEFDGRCYGAPVTKRAWEEALAATETGLADFPERKDEG